MKICQPVFANPTESPGQAEFPGLVVNQLGTEMDYWPTARWKTLITSGDDEAWNEPVFPFLLIGEGPLSDNEDTSPLAYIACCFEDSIEAWPICPIAFARWGTIEPQHDLLVGRRRIRFFHEHGRAWKQACQEETPLWRASKASDRNRPMPMAAHRVPQIELSWDGKTQLVPLHRRVTILGAEHPSVLRLRSQGMARCDHAIVTVGESVWLIDLNASPGMAVEKLVTKLKEKGPPAKVGQIEMTLVSASQWPIDAQEPPNQITKYDHGVDEPESTGVKQAIGSQTPSISVDTLSAQVTDRLVRVGTARSWRSRIGSLILFGAGATALYWIVIQMLLPKIQEIPHLFD